MLKLLSLIIFCSCNSSLHDSDLVKQPNPAIDLVRTNSPMLAGPSNSPILAGLTYIAGPSSFISAYLYKY